MEDAKYVIGLMLIIALGIVLVKLGKEINKPFKMQCDYHTYDNTRDFVQ